MADVLRSLHAALLAWTEDAAARRWLPADAARTLEGAVLATPGALFEPGGRPLVAALFGGTGVGKSTLMNRLAREPIARASAERPTSRDVTVYAHRGTAVERLGETLPMERVRTTLHANDAWRDVLWLDMPDIDSVETANRELVTRWLPHVDALLYVVSPERYRDDEGWRLLLEHGANHAWLFVVNHWDRGDERQIEDFRALLSGAGLADPLIFRTDSAPGGGVGDDFAELEATLAALADRKLVEQLEARGVLQRVAALRARGDALRTRLGGGTASAAGTEEPEATLESDWEAHWEGEAAALDETLGWRIAVQARALGERPSGRGPLGRAAALIGLGGGAPNASEAPVAGASGTAASGLPASGPSAAGTPFDTDALDRVDGAIERFARRMDESGTLPHGVSERLLGPVRAALPERLPRLVDDALQRSLAEPGNRWQRAAWRLCGALAGLLPLAVMLWIGWRALSAFGRGGSDPAAYLGSDFAVNGALLLALAWLLPLFLRHRLAPSRERAAARGLKAGTERALEEVRTTVAAALAAAADERRALASRYAALWRGEIASAAGADAAALPEAVRRMLFDGSAGPAGVRASTQSSTARAPVS